MTAQQTMPTPVNQAPVALRYAVVPLTGLDIAAVTVTAMLDNAAGGSLARFLAPGEHLPYGAAPVLVSDTTLYGARQLEQILRRWGPLPRPWLVGVADAPPRPVQDARFLVRSLTGRLAGVATVPYLPVLRAVATGEEALEHKDVRSAAAALRRTIEGK